MYFLFSDVETELVW